MIELDDLEVRRGAFMLRIPRLEARRGRTLAVLGPNGAGKSTLLEILALLRRPGRGRVRLLGEEPKGRTQRLRLRRRLALAMQDPFLLSGSVLDNVRLPLRLRGVPSAEARRRAGDWIERFGIGAAADKPARQLSGGQARRASLARALACDPDVLLLDEPFSALDPPGRDALLRDFQRLLAPETAVVLVTHDRSEALGLAHEVAVLEAGHLLQWGPTQEVFRRPASEEVAALAGIETLLSGRAGAGGGGLCRIEVAPGTWVEARGEAEAGSRVTLCIHPEEVVLERGPRTGRTTARNIYDATVRSLAPQGGLCRVELECPFPLVALITRRSSEELELRPGERVSAAFKASAVHLFPARRASS